MSTQMTGDDRGVQFRAKFRFTVQEDRSDEVGESMSVTRTKTAERTLELADREATKSDALDVVQELCEDSADEGYDTVDVRILKEKRGIDDWNWQENQDIVAEDITQLRYDLPLDVRTVEYADFIEGVDEKVLVDLSAPNAGHRGTGWWNLDEFVRQNDLEEYAVNVEDSTARQLALLSLIDRGFDHLLAENEVPTEKLVEGARVANTSDGEADGGDEIAVTRGDLFDFRDPDQFYTGNDELGPEDPPVCVECGDELLPGTIAAVRRDDGIIHSDETLCGWCFDPAAAPDDADRDGGPFIYPVGTEDAHYTPAGKEPLSHEELAEQRVKEWRENTPDEEIEEMQESMKEMREMFSQSADEDEEDSER